MISFIVIGKNEGWKLTKCFVSIFNFISRNNIENYEVIYVDSKSTDDSIDRAKKFSEVKILLITGECNAAIARNIGAKESTGTILYFIDGDMEILSDFYEYVFDTKRALKYNFVSGDFIDINYDRHFNYISKEKYYKLQNNITEITTGGIFIIKRNVWNNENGMDTSFIKNQDLEFGIRLAKKGILLNRLKNLIAIHHTIPYNDNLRRWNYIFSGAELYPSVLLRKHFNFFPVYIFFLKENYTLVVFLLVLILNLIVFLPLTFISYLIILIYKNYLSIRVVNFKFLLGILYYFVRDISRLLALFLFWPKSKKISYVKIK